MRARHQRDIFGTLIALAVLIVARHARAAVEEFKPTPELREFNRLKVPKKDLADIAARHRRFLEDAGHAM